MTSRRYSGELYYNVLPGRLIITNFIIRENEIGFSLVSATGEHGRWEAESGKPALIQSDGSYVAKNVNATNNGETLSHPWDIVFRIEDENIGHDIEVSGELRENGETYEFEGELKPDNQGSRGEQVTELRKQAAKS